MERFLLVVVLSLAATCGFAQGGEGLLLPFDGKTQQEIAAEFEADLGNLVRRFIAENRPPRSDFRMDGKVVPMICVDVEPNADGVPAIAVWKRVVRSDWDNERVRYTWSHDPLDDQPQRTPVTSILEEEIARCFPIRARDSKGAIALAIWIYHRNLLRQPDRLWMTNAVLAELAQVNPDRRSYIEAWLAEKHGWDLPADGLVFVDTHDLIHRVDGRLLMPESARDAYAREMLPAAREAWEDILRLAPDRRRQAEMRLDMLLDRVNRFEKAYGFTGFLDQGRNRRNYEALKNQLSESLERVEKDLFGVDRMIGEGRVPEAARLAEDLLRLDPHNPAVIEKAAKVNYQMAGVQERHDGGALRVANRDAARRAAELYERLTAIWPLRLTYYNFAGQARLAAGDASAARTHFQQVLNRTEGKSELTDADKQNREFARRHMP